MKRWTNGLPGATKGLGANLALRGLSVSQSGCARIPMMARSKIAPLQRPNTLMQLSRSSVLELPLATRGRAIHFGTSATWRPLVRSSAIGWIADLREPLQKGPKSPDRHAKQHHAAVRFSRPTPERSSHLLEPCPFRRDGWRPGDCEREMALS